MGFSAVEVVPSPKLQCQLLGLPVEVSEKLTLNGALPDVGLAVKPATSVGAEAPSGSSMCQYVSLVALFAITTMPVLGSTFCFVEVASFMSGEPASRTTGVPIPDAKE